METKIYISLTILIIHVLSCFSQTEIDSLSKASKEVPLISKREPIVQFEQDSLYGFREIYSKRVIINPVYTNIDNLYSNRMIAAIDGKVGMIDSLGKVLIPHEYDKLMRASLVNHCKAENFGIEKKIKILMAVKNGKWGLINFENQILVPFEWERGAWYNEFKLFFKKDKEQILTNYEGEIVFKGQYDLVWPLSKCAPVLKVGKDKKMGLVDYQNNTLAPIEFSDISNAIDDIVRLKYENNAFRLFSLSRKKYIGGIYKNASYSQSGLLTVQDFESGKVGVIDTFGNVKIPLEFVYCSYLDADNRKVFSNLVFVKRDSVGALFDTSGVRLTDFDYEYATIEPNNKDVIVLKLPSKKYHVVGKTGENIMLGEFDNYFVDKSFISLKKDGNWAFFRPNGEQLTRFTYPAIMLLKENETVEVKVKFPKKKIIAKASLNNGGSVVIDEDGVEYSY